jgi:hypothetical protein
MLVDAMMRARRCDIVAEIIAHETRTRALALSARAGYPAAR